MTAQNGVNTALTRPGRVSLGRLHMGGQVQGDKASMGGTHEGGHRPWGT